MPMGIPSGGVANGGKAGIGYGGAATTVMPVALGGRTAASTSGRTASGGRAGMATPICWHFVDSTEGWAKSYASTFIGPNSEVRDEAASNVLLANSIADWMADPGYGGVNGYVRLTIPFAMAQSEYKGLGYSYIPSAPLQLRNRTITAYVKVVAGMTADDPSVLSGATLFVRSGPNLLYRGCG
jgi:hypothetical protein